MGDTRFIGEGQVRFVMYLKYIYIHLNMMYSEIYIYLDVLKSDNIHNIAN